MVLSPGVRRSGLLDVLQRVADNTHQNTRQPGYLRIAGTPGEESAGAYSKMT